MTTHSRNGWGIARYDHCLILLLWSLCLGMAAACAIPSLAGDPTGLPLGMALLTLGLLLASRRRLVRQGSLWLLAFWAGVFYFQAVSFRPAADDVIHQAPVWRAHCEAVLKHRHLAKQKAVVGMLRVNGQRVSGQAELTHTALATVPLGARIRFTGDLAYPRSSRIPGGFDQARFLRHQKITTVVYHINDLQVLPSHPALSWQGLAADVLNRLEQDRARMATVFRQVLPSPQAEILGGLVLGEHAVPVDRATKARFLHTGLFHLLAASGMNVGIVGGAVLGISRWIGLPFALRLVLAMACVGAYALLTGLPPSIQRASVMFELALALKLLNRSLSPVFVLTIAAAAILLVNPDAVASLGFQFSVLTTLGILTMVPALQRRAEAFCPPWASGILLVPVIAQLWVTPLSIYHFNDMALLSVPLNIVALVLITPLTFLGFSAGALALAIPDWGAWLAGLCKLPLDGLLGLATWGDTIRWSRLHLASPPAWLVVLAYGLLTLWLGLLVRGQALPRVRKAWLIFGALAAILTPLIWQPWHASPFAQISLLPTGPAKTALVITQPGVQAALAILPQRANQWDERAIGDYLTHGNIRRLAALIPQGGALRPSQLAHPALGSIPADGVAPLGWVDRLRWGTLTIRRLGDDHWMIAQHGRCLLTLSARWPSDCRGRVLTPVNQAYRLVFTVRPVRPAL